MGRLGAREDLWVGETDTLKGSGLARGKEVVMRSLWVVCVVAILAVCCGSGSKPAAPPTTAAPTTTAPAGPLGEVEILVAPGGGFLASVPSSGLWTLNVAVQLQPPPALRDGARRHLLVLRHPPLAGCESWWHMLVPSPKSQLPR